MQKISLTCFEMCNDLKSLSGFLVNQISFNLNNLTPSNYFTQFNHFQPFQPHSFTLAHLRLSASTCIHHIPLESTCVHLLPPAMICAQTGQMSCLGLPQPQTVVFSWRNRFDPGRVLFHSLEQIHQFHIETMDFWTLILDPCKDLEHLFI